MAISVDMGRDVRFEIKSPFEDKVVMDIARFDKGFSKSLKWDPASKVWWTKEPNALSAVIQAAQERSKGIALSPVADQMFREVGARAAEDAEKAAKEKAEATRIAVERAQAVVEASRQADVDYEPPAPLGQSYLPFQKAGVKFALDRYAEGWPGVILGDAMGLGKSVQLAGIINEIDPSEGRILVTCPAFLKLNLKREIEKWDTRGRSVAIWDTKQQPDADVIVVNYDIVHKKGIVEKLRGEEWALLACDEAHYLKNVKAKRTQVVLGDFAYRDPKVGLPSKRRLLMSGTPLTNRPKELFPLVKTCMSKTAAVKAPDGQDITKAFTAFWNPSRPQDSFAGRFCGGQQGRFGLECDGSSNLDELQFGLRSSFMVRRLKEDVLKELPPKVRQIVEVSADDPEAKAALKNEVKARENAEKTIADLKAKAELAKAEGRDAYKKAVEAMKVGVAASIGEMAKARHEVALAKVPAVIEQINSVLEEEAAVVVFGHHRDVIAKISEAFAGDVGVITGDTPMQDRQDLVDAFQAGKFRVMVGNIQAMGVGLTLTRASTVVFAELDWVPASMSQAEDRCHRIGQESNVLVLHVVLDGSMDAGMAKKLVAKQDVIDRVLDREDPEAEEKAEAALSRQETEVAEVSKGFEVPDYKVAATAEVIERELPGKSKALTPSDIDDIHAALLEIAGTCDGARAEDGRGFSKVDSAIGRTLALSDGLTPKQAVLGLSLAHRYRRQLPDDLKARIAAVRKSVDEAGKDEAGEEGRKRDPFAKAKEMKTSKELERGKVTERKVKDVAW